MRVDEVVLLRDSSWVAAAMEQWDRSRRLAPRGRTVPPRLVRGLLEQGIAAQRTVWTDDHRPAGLLQVTDVSERDGTGMLDLLVDPVHTAALRHELVRFLNQAFADLPLRKLSVWACDDEMAVPRYLGTVAHPAGRLAGHDRRGPGQHADMLIYEIWKEDVDGHVPAAVERIGHPG
jgi:hypothetical protein